MKQFQTLLKVKSFEEIKLIEEISQINETIYTYEINITKIQGKIIQYKMDMNKISNTADKMSMTLITGSLEEDKRIEEILLNTALQEKQVIYDKLVSIRQDIKAIEKLLDKKRETKRLQELYKEQELLDELNTIES